MKSSYLQYTNLTNKPFSFHLFHSELDFNKNLVDLTKLKYYLSKRILEINKMEHGAPIPMEKLTNQFDRPEGFERLFQWLGGDQREIDPDELDQQLHTTTPILLDDEKCIMAFKAGRDMSIFTNLRIMQLDVQGLSGQKIEYSSVPLRNIRAFAVESAGVWDRDTEANFYTRNRWDMGKVEMDFRTGKADIMQIQKLLSTVVCGLPNDPHVNFGPKNYGNAKAKPVTANSFAAAFFDNSKEVDAAEMNTVLHSDPPLLLEEETVLRAFKQARDMFIYTDRRMIIIDTKGLSGKRTKYKSVPYKHMDGFEIETAGHLDRDAEIYLHCNITNVDTIKQSILVKHTDIYDMHKLCTDHTLFGAKYEEEPDIIVE
jgi:hypothetical protein